MTAKGAKGLVWWGEDLGTATSVSGAQYTSRYLKGDLQKKTGLTSVHQENRGEEPVGRLPEEAVFGTV